VIVIVIVIVIDGPNSEMKSLIPIHFMLIKSLSIPDRIKENCPFRVTDNILKMFQENYVIGSNNNNIA
jgi:hypothetical protein